MSQAEPLPAQRPIWTCYFLEMAHFVASRATCLQRPSGAVLVQERRVLATGYNGAPSGMAHCSATGCTLDRAGPHGACRGLHAEQNVLLQAAHYGIAAAGTDLYCTEAPCGQCAKMLANAGIRRVYYGEGDPEALTLEVARACALDLVRLATRTRYPPTTLSRRGEQP